MPVRPRWMLVFVLVLLSGLASAGEPVKLAAADGGAVFGTFTHARGEGAADAVLLLFHQAGASRHEYDPLIPALTGAGYDTLAIDQRSGDGLFGGRNETVAQRGGSSGYLDALPDLEAALAWAVRHRYRRIVAVGSSYSASLTILLAAAHPHELAAIASFSPGEYFADKNQVKRAAARVAVPFYITTDPQEEGKVDEVLRDAHGASIVRYRPATGVHGASTLVRARDPKGAEANLRSFLGFLRQVKDGSAR